VTELRHDPARAAAFYDEYGDREWTRFDDGRTSPVSAATHAHYLRRFVRAGDRVLDVGAGPGRFTIELARIGARIVVADVSPGQLDLNRRHVAEAGAEDAVEERVVADVCDLAAFADASFDATVCYGGPVSYALDRAPDAVRELARVTRPSGHVLVSAMCLVGATAQQFSGVLDVAREAGVAAVDGVTATGILPPELGGHFAMKLYRWRELRALLEPHGEIVAAAATGLLRVAPEEPELRELAERTELDLGAEPGAIEAGQHILAVVRV
jgi:SAM-dependent methyltransferase